VDATDSAGFDFEVIFVDDGSTSATTNTPAGIQKSTETKRRFSGPTTSCGPLQWKKGDIGSKWRSGHGCF
jgi:hypothetical protein